MQIHFPFSPSVNVCVRVCSVLMAHLHQTSKKVNLEESEEKASKPQSLVLFFFYGNGVCTSEFTRRKG